MTAPFALTCKPDEARDAASCLLASGEPALVLLALQLERQLVEARDPHPWGRPC